MTIFCNEIITGLRSPWVKVIRCGSFNVATFVRFGQCLDIFFGCIKAMR